jgi:cellobiose phosphorylase
MGGGDWNDGMNNVGIGGKGESVWLGFFIYYVMNQFYEILHHEKKYDDAEYIKSEIATLKTALEESSWDGHWFIRAFFDDGTPLGSDSSGECKIDVISQAWAIISGIATKEQAQSASKYVDKYLFDKKYKMLKLLWPAFDKWEKDAGYIKGYIPGIRENGAQYTHGAVWMLIAYCVMGDGNRAYDLLSALNPINHARTVNDTDIYKVEPYVVAADIYAAPGQRGRGGWTWYTGSAAWLYKAILEYVLGIKKIGEKLYIKPCIPDSWNGFEVNYLYESARYNIRVVKKSKGVSLQQKITEDGKEIYHGYIKLINDNKEHNIDILL